MISLIPASNSIYQWTIELTSWSRFFQTKVSPKASWTKVPKMCLHARDHDVQVAAIFLSFYHEILQLRTLLLHDPQHTQSRIVWSADKLSSRMWASAGAHERCCGFTSSKSLCLFFHLLSLSLWAPPEDGGRVRAGGQLEVSCQLRFSSAANSRGLTCNTDTWEHGNGFRFTATFSKWEVWLIAWRNNWSSVF